MWDGVRIVRRLADDDPDPTPEELAALAHDLLACYPRRQDGVLPNVRVLEARTTRTPPTDLVA
jgi:hypothetical protein